MRAHGQNIGRAIGEMNAGAGERDQHHLAREIAGRMSHRLVGGGDPATRGVIINAEMHAPAAAIRRVHQRAERDLAALIDDRLRSFDHRFKEE